MICSVLCAVTVAGCWLSPQTVALAYWSDPIILEFVLGMGIALLYRNGFQLPATLRLSLIGAGVFAVWFSAPHMPPSGYRVLLWGIPAAMVFAGAVLGKHPNFGWFTPLTETNGRLIVCALSHPSAGNSYDIR